MCFSPEEEEEEEEEEENLRNLRGIARVIPDRCGESAVGAQALAARKASFRCRERGADFEGTRCAGFQTGSANGKSCTIQTLVYLCGRYTTLIHSSVLYLHTCELTSR